MATPLTVNISTQHKGSSYDIEIGYGLLANTGNKSRAALGKTASRVVLVADRTVFKLYGRSVVESFTKVGFQVSTFLLSVSESSKSLANAERLLKFFADSGLTRTDAVAALGGGVVGDLAGFAAAVYLRGIGMIQVPTTLLSMVDSSVGGKTGVNSAFGKNTIGSFHHPAAVFADLDTLSTLPPREVTAGLCEMIKHAAISGNKLMRTTKNFLDVRSNEHRDLGTADPLFRKELSELIALNIAFKAEIVAGDEREMPTRTGARSRKVLNFGHTCAHALETVTHYRYFRHGEAVGYGMLFAAELSKKLALCGETDVKLLYDVVHRAGTLPPLADIDPRDVFEAFRFDKKNVGGSLQFVLLRGIGKPVIVSSDDISSKQILSALEKLFRASLSA